LLKFIRMVLQWISSNRMNQGTINSESRILIVDDDQNLREQLLRAFMRRGYYARAAANYEEAVYIVTNDIRYTHAVIDLRMPSKSGMLLLSKILELSPHTKVVILTGYGSISSAVDAIQLGAVNYVCKPANADDIINAFTNVQAKKTVPVDTKDNPTTPSLAQAEWEHLHRVLADCNGNISQAAIKLGITRRTLQRKLKKLPP
jgi:two-component system, response regulator RegA